MSSNEFSVLVHGQPMDYIEFGEGTRPMVLITGMSMSGLSGLGDAVAAACKEYATQYRVYVFDRLRTLPIGYTIQDMAEDIAIAMEELGICNADMMGSSQGGMILQWLAISHPELVHSAVISSSLCMPNPLSNANFTLWRDIAKKRDPQAVYNAFFHCVYPEEFLQENAAVLSSMASTGTPEQCDRFAVLSEACRIFDCSTRLNEIHCPVLVIGVKGDKVLTGEASKTISEKIGCPIFMYEGYNHPVCDEAPDYQRRLLDFFSQV